VKSHFHFCPVTCTSYALAGGVLISRKTLNPHTPMTMTKIKGMPLQVSSNSVLWVGAWAGLV